MDLDRDEAVTKVKKELIFPGITALHHFAWNGDVEAVQTRYFCSSASTPGPSKRGARRRRARCCFYDGSSPDSPDSILVCCAVT